MQVTFPIVVIVILQSMPFNTGKQECDIGSKVRCLRLELIQLFLFWLILKTLGNPAHNAAEFVMNLAVINQLK